MKSIEEQIAGRCIHFNGIINKTCKKGVEYDSFGKVKFQVIPCLVGGTKTCQWQQFPTPEEVAKEVAKEVAEIRQASVKTFGLIAAAKEHYESTKQNPATFKCPNGDHNATYVISTSNGHFWIRCKTCEINLNE